MDSALEQDDTLDEPEDSPSGGEPADLTDDVESTGAIGMSVSADQGEPSSPSLYTSPGSSALRHRGLVAVLTILGLVAGVVFAYVRPPTYTATATTYVGKTLSLNNTAAIAGLATAATQIAQDYSRVIAAQTVTEAVSKALGHPGTLGGTLTATEIPNTPEIQIIATASSQYTALRLANAGAKALIAAVSQLNASSAGELKSLLTSYQRLESQINTEQVQQAQIQSEVSALESKDPTSTQLPALQSQLETLRTEVSTNTLQANAVEGQYANNYSPLENETQVISPLSAAAANGSDRKKAIELGLIVGFFAGLLLGVALASTRDLRGTGRANRALLGR
jgi:capsular polysaccharide biosynthesis protein